MDLLKVFLMSLIVGATLVMAGLTFNMLNQMMTKLDIVDSNSNRHLNCNIYPKAHGC